MPTGAIFARRSRQALKWVVTLCVVFALGAASAAAQITITTPKTVSEGGRLTISVTAEIDVPTSQSTVGAITITPTISKRTPSAAEMAGGLSVAEDADYDAPAPTSLTLDVEPNTGSATVSRTLTGVILVQTQSDPDAEDEAITISYRLGGSSDATDKGTSTPVTLKTGSDSADVTIDDTDTQSFTWRGDTTSAKEGAAFPISIEADPPLVDLTFAARFSIDDGYTIEPTSHTFTAAGGDDPTPPVDPPPNLMPQARVGRVAGANGPGPTAMITVTPPDSDGNREEDTVTLRVIKAGSDEDLAAPRTIEVADIHGLPGADQITVQAFTVDENGDKTETEAASVVEGGDPVVVTVTVDRGTDGYPDGEKLNVAVSPRDGSQGQDYWADLDQLEIADGTREQTADFKLWALADDDVGDEDLVLSLVATGDTPANGPGEVAVTFSLPIEDVTTPLVVVRDDADEAIEAALGAAPLNTGDAVQAAVAAYPLNTDRTVEIRTVDLFEWDDDAVAVSFSTSVDGSAVSAVASGQAVTLTATAAGEAEVTVTATASVRGGSLTVRQYRADVAQLTFPVTVEPAALAITLTGPDDVNLVEGMSYAITAEASRAVTEDTVVELTPTAGTASPADYEVEPITIAAGETSGSAMLTVVEDGESDAGAGSPEMLTLAGRVGAMTTNALTFHLWDAAVPALPVVAQLLLAALLGLGGYRRFRRR